MNPAVCIYNKNGEAVENPEEVTTLADGQFVRKSMLFTDGAPIEAAQLYRDAAHSAYVADLARGWERPGHRITTQPVADAAAAHDAYVQYLNTAWEAR